MTRLTITACIVTIAAAAGFCQITLDECRAKARANFPLIRQHDLLAASEKYTLSNANRGYLPQVTFSGKATWQSEVTRLDLAGSATNPAMAPLLSSMPSFEVDKDQYQGVVEINQLVWDGGAIRAQKKSLRAATESEQKKLETDLYALNERVQQLFFGCVLLSGQLEQNDLLGKELQTSYERVAAYIAGGVANQADLDAVNVEQLNTRQRRIELLAQLTTYRDMLGLLIGEPIPETATLVTPPMAGPDADTALHRPELDLFESQKTLLESQTAAINAALLPKINLFFQGGFGRPGLNMLSNDFSPFCITGVRLMWNLSGLYTRSNTIRKIRLEMDKVESLRETFLFNTRIQVRQQTGDIDKFRELIGNDEHIITLRTAIKKAAEAKVANGTLGVPDLLREITAENLARQAKALHELQLLMSLYTLENTRNNQEKQ
jgi:outer membrane protein TolC